MTREHSKIIDARKLKGFRDLLPYQAKAREEIFRTARAHAQRAGFQFIDTPSLEYADVLLGSGSDETDKEVYRFIDHGDREVALRFDLTVPFARFVSENYPVLVFPFKKFQIGEVWRGEKPQKGRYRQFCQADLDIIGADSIAADIEVISCLFKIIESILPQHSGFRMILNNRQILSGLIRLHLGHISSQDEGKVLIAVDKMEKIGIDGVARLLNFPKDNVERFLTALQKPLKKAEDWQQLEKAFSQDQVARNELVRMQRTVACLQSLNEGSRGSFEVVLSVARGLGYYTGIVFETQLDLKGFGSIASGGRYNNLVGRFGKYNLAGVGGSIGVDRVLAACEELGLQSDPAPAKVFVAIANEAATEFALRLVNTLRSATIACDVGVREGSKLGNQIKHANKLKIPYLIVIGSDEILEQKFSLKNLNTGQEVKDLDVTGLVKNLTSSPTPE